MLDFVDENSMGMTKDEDLNKLYSPTVSYGRLPLLPPASERNPSPGRRVLSNNLRNSSPPRNNVYSGEGLDLYNTRQSHKDRGQTEGEGSNSSSTTSTALSDSSLANMMMDQNNNKRLAYFSTAAAALTTEWFVRQKQKPVVTVSEDVAQRPAALSTSELPSSASYLFTDKDANALESRDDGIDNSVDFTSSGPLFNEFRTKRKPQEETPSEAPAAAVAERTLTLPKSHMMNEKPLASERSIVPPRDESNDSLDLIPAMYRRAAELEQINPENLARFFLPDGFLVARCFSAFRYRKDIIEECRCCLKVGRDMPVFKFTNLMDGKSRLLLPDLRVEHTPAAQALDCFIDYQWPNGDHQLLDLKHTDGEKILPQPLKASEMRQKVRIRINHVLGVMAHFRNAREPVYFVTPGEDQQLLMDCLTVVRRVARNQNVERRSQFNLSLYNSPSLVPIPSKLNGRSRQKLLAELPRHEDLEAYFGAKLDDAARRLVSSRAVANYWKNEQIIWTAYWSPDKGKYKRAQLYVFIHPYSPCLVVSDKKGGAAVVGVLNLQAYSCSRLDMANDSTIPMAVRNQRLAPHVTCVECLDHDYQMFFSFETVELLKDFQQTVATLGYLQHIGSIQSMREFTTQISTYG